MPSPVPSRTGPRRILVRGVNWLGDAVMTLPALTRLREAYPAAQIALLIPAKLATLWDDHPAVDAVLPIAPAERLWTVARRVREGRFEAGLILPNSARSALELWWGGVPRRVGASSPGRDWLLTERVPQRAGHVAMVKRSPGEIRRLVAATVVPVREQRPPGSHQVNHYLHLAAALGASSEPCAPKLRVSDAEKAEVRARFGLGPADRWCGLNAGAEYGPAKRWPWERFVAAAIEVQRRARVRWVIMGGGADRELAGKIESGIRAGLGGGASGVPLNLAGRTSLRDLCGVLSLCECLLTNDTGPMHVGAAVGARVVALFGSTDPELTGPGLPGSPGHRVLRTGVPCAPCFLRDCPIDLRCLRSLTEPAVVAACLDLLAFPGVDPIIPG